MNPIPARRAAAFARQSGRCCYCDLPMLPTAQVPRYAALLKLEPKSAELLAATAEHLLARSEGGSDVALNIAAAHRLCNARRHQLRPAPSPDKYRKIVQAQLRSGGWMKKKLRQVLSCLETRPKPGDSFHSHQRRS